MTRLNALQPLGLLLLRVVLGIIFISHGYPKLFHAGSMTGAFTQHNLPAYATIISLLEVFGGALLVLGLFTRVAALLLTLEMAVAIWKVYGSGLAAFHSYEFPLTLLAGCFSLVTLGAGRASLDYALYESGASRSRAKSKPKS